GELSASLPAVLLADKLLNYEMDKENEVARQGIGTLLRFPGGTVPAPGRSTPVASGPGDSCEGPAVELPTGSTAEFVTVRKEAEEDGEIRESGSAPLPLMETENKLGTTPKKNRKELRLQLVRTKVVSITGNTATVRLAGRMPTSGEIVNSPIAESVSAGTPALSGSGDGIDVGDAVSSASSAINVEMEQEEATEVDLTITTPTEGTEDDLSSSFDQVPRKGKKRGRKPKGSNCPGAHALTKTSTKRMDYEDDELDRVDFFKIPKRPGHGLKKRKGLVECELDDRLTSAQKDAIKEVTALFPQMSPKAVMAETLRVLETAGEAERRTQTMKGDLRRQIKVGVNVAKIAVQRLVSEILKDTGPTDEIRANNQALEREVVKLRREVDTLRRERETMREQINALQGTVQEMEERDKKRGRGRRYAPSSDEEDRNTGPLIRTRGQSREERPVLNRDNEIDEAGSLPPAYRSAIGGVRKRVDDRSPRLTRVNERGDIVARGTRKPALSKCGVTHTEGIGGRLVSENRGAGPSGDRDRESPPPSKDYPADGEPWTEARTKRAQKRLRKRERARAAPEVSAEVQDKRGVVPPPLAGGATAGVRRAGTGTGAAGTSARSGAPRGPTLAGAVSRPRAVGAGDVGRRPPPPPVRDNRFRAPRTAAVLISPDLQ
ncbi:hypothetical protein ALC57_06591, partial [Trachymyrmex cornetzi]